MQATNKLHLTALPTNGGQECLREPGQPRSLKPHKQEVAAQGDCQNEPAPELLEKLDPSYPLETLLPNQCLLLSSSGFFRAQPGVPATDESVWFDNLYMRSINTRNFLAGGRPFLIMFGNDRLFVTRTTLQDSEAQEGRGYGLNAGQMRTYIQGSQPTACYLCFVTWAIVAPFGTTRWHMGRIPK